MDPVDATNTSGVITKDDGSHENAEDPVDVNVDESDEEADDGQSPSSSSSSASSSTRVGSSRSSNRLGNYERRGTAGKRLRRK